MKSIKHFMVLWLLLFAGWLVLNSSTHLQVIIVGLVVATLLTIILGRKNSIFSQISFSPKSIAYMAIYVFVFGIEVIKSNLDVAFRVITPKVRIRPGIVEIKTKLKSDLGKLILANSITLTPGTLTVDIKGDSLFIHWIDVKEEDVELATKEISSTFEKYLEVICG